MHKRALDEQVARLLGDQPIPAPKNDMDVKTAWCDAEGHMHFTTDDGPPFYSAGGAYGTAPLILAEVERRNVQKPYIAALLRLLDPEGKFGLYWSALESETRGHPVEMLLWKLISATPEHHCRAFVATLGQGAFQDGTTEERGP